jgi:phage shock protein PspC (stress-responsive transcriptional regulator)
MDFPQDPAPSSPPKKLRRSNNRKFCGVCGGLAEYFDLDPTVVRVFWSLLTIFTVFSGAVAYGILALAMPEPLPLPPAEKAKPTSS